MARGYEGSQGSWGTQGDHGYDGRRDGWNEPSQHGVPSHGPWSHSGAASYISSVILYTEMCSATSE